jgi:hypothetical protein
MSRTGSTGVLALRWVPTIANIAAPTVAEINAGTDLTSKLTRDGLDRPLDGQSIDTADVSNGHNNTAPGSFGGQGVTGKFLRDTVSGSDTAWTTLTRLASGYLVVRPFGGSTGASGDAFAAGQRVEVWPSVVNTRKPIPIADNEAQKFEAKFDVTSAPNLDAVVA